MGVICSILSYRSISYGTVVFEPQIYPSKIEWDLTNGPIRKLLGVIRYTGLGVRSVGPVGDFLEYRGLLNQLTGRSCWLFHPTYKPKLADQAREFCHQNSAL